MCLRTDRPLAKGAEIPPAGGQAGVLGWSRCRRSCSERRNVPGAVVFFFGLSSFSLVFCLVFRLLLWSFVWSFGLCSQPSGPFRCSVFRQVAIFDRALSALVVDICTSRIAFVLGGLGRGLLASAKYATQRHRNCSAALAAFSAT